MTIRFVDLFSGIGGFRLGLERASEEYKCVWSCDWDKYANRVYRFHFGEENHHAGDVRQVDANSIPDHDVLCAGFPCQAFSVAGKRKGFEDTRGTLFFEIARIAEAKRPPLLLLENVKGLLSCQGGYAFARILQTLDELGYWVEWQVLNSKHFGVPQNRERVFIVGHLRGAGGREVFPIGASQEMDSEKHKEGEAVSATLKAKLRNPSVTWHDTYVASTVDSSYYKGHDHKRQLVCVADGGRAYRVYDPRGLSPTLPTSCGGLHEPKIIEDFRRVRIRKLTPVECERLQGFPDGWTKHGKTKDGKTVEISDTQRYRLLGNAVTVNVVEYLGKRLLEALP